MTKTELIEWIQENMPEEAEAFKSGPSEYREYDIVIFSEKHDKNFYDWFFGI